MHCGCKPVLQHGNRSDGLRMQIQQAHSVDVMAMDWSADGYLIATGDADGRLTVYDIRTMSDCASDAHAAAEPLHVFGPTDKTGKAVLSVCWNPLRPVRRHLPRAQMWRIALHAEWAPCIAGAVVFVIGPAANGIHS